MKKTIFILIIILVAGFSGTAREWKSITSEKPQAAKIDVVSSTAAQTVLHYQLAGFYLQPVLTPQGEAFTVQAAEMTPLLEAGAPDLPKAANSVVIPDMSGTEVRILSSSYTDFPGLFIAPSKGVIMRDTDPATVPYQFGQVYNTDGFFPGKLADLREPHIIRDFRGQTVLFYPFQYNPVSKVLRVYHNVTLELVVVAGTGENPMPVPVADKKINRAVLPVLSRHFINIDAIAYTPLEDYGNLLVICHPEFMDAMIPYVNWKNASGYPTEMVSTDTTGTTPTAIKDYITNYFNTKGLTHVLLVGDKAQIPTITSGVGGPSDNAYGYLVGSDHYSDVFIGRFSAETVDHVQTQVQRTLDYEIDPQFLTEDWFTTVIGIASQEGPGDDGEYDYQHVRNMQTQLLAYKYTWNPELFEGSQGGNDAPGHPTPTLVATEVNDGASLILYTGHGSTTSWSTSGFSNNNVNQLTNMGKLPFIWSVACVNGNFLNTTCFAEAWLRASQNGEPTGAIAFLGSTINQSWDPPMEGQDEMVDILAESYPDNIKRTFAGISINGCMKMIDSYGTDGRNMADTWTVFGDPTVMVRTTVPDPITVVHDNTVDLGDSTFLLLSSFNGARATLTVADTILCTGTIQNDSLIMIFPTMPGLGDTLHLVVTDYNAIPYQADVLVDDPIIYPAVAGFFGTPERVLPGYTVVFADTSAGTVTSWLWSFPGGTPSTSTRKNPVITYHERGVYDVILIAGNELMADTLVKEAYITCDYAIGTDERNSGQLTITPNPGHGEFTITAPDWKGTQASLRLVNLSGQTVYSNTISVTSGRIQSYIDVTQLPKGIYFLHLSGGLQQQVRKVVIQ